MKKFTKIKTNHTPILLAGLISVAAYLLRLFLFSTSAFHISGDGIQGTRIMTEAIHVIREYCQQNQIPIDETVDPNRTGLIGLKHSEIATSLGFPETKRTTTNPYLAGLMVHLFLKAGVQKGDTVVISGSGSFPALYIASMCAAEAMSVRPVSMISLGSSSYGATRLDFNLLHIVDVLYREHIFSVRPVIVSLGGEKDIGLGFIRDTNKKLMQQISDSGIHFVYEPNLIKNITARLSFLKNQMNVKKIAAFVNIGGSYSNLGTSALILKVKPGLNKALSLPDESERGLLFEMASRGIPCIHLLHIRGLVQQYGLPWDPVPLPEVSDRTLLHQSSPDSSGTFILAGIYFGLLIVLFFYRRIRVIFIKDQSCNIS